MHLTYPARANLSFSLAHMPLAAMALLAAPYVRNVGICMTIHHTLVLYGRPMFNSGVADRWHVLRTHVGKRRRDEHEGNLIAVALTYSGLETPVVQLLSDSRKRENAVGLRQTGRP